MNAGEYGWVLQAISGQSNPGVQIEVYYADMLPGYAITESSVLNYSGSGWGGWSAPAGAVVSGGGYQFENTAASPSSSQLALEGSVWPHYTFGADEQGWVVQNGGVASSANIYVVSFDAPAQVPEPGSLALVGGALGLMAGLRRRKRTG